ncbi:hypothetical protein ACH5RR_016404 [Cinchona calisaya]|uniref:Uncharacterized protein n=1 Tax=Cinchona calisaya TaxID=153742 RepID=A0ABD2ZZ00_9GENT
MRMAIMFNYKMVPNTATGASAFPPPSSPSTMRRLILFKPQIRTAEDGEKGGHKGLALFIVEIAKYLGSPKRRVRLYPAKDFKFNRHVCRKSTHAVALSLRLYSNEEREGDTIEK